MIEVFKGEQDNKSYYTISRQMTKEAALQAIARDRKVSPNKLVIVCGTIKRDAKPDLDRLYIQGDEGDEMVWVAKRR